MRWLTLALAAAALFVALSAQTRISREGTMRACNENALANRVAELAIRVKVEDFTEAEYRAFMDDLYEAPGVCIRVAYDD